MFNLEILFIALMIVTCAKGANYIELLDGELVEGVEKWTLQSVQSVEKGIGGEFDVGVPQTKTAAAERDFSIDLFNALMSADNTTNLVMSPLSIYTALSMLRPGLQGRSLEQVNRGMYLQDRQNFSQVYGVMRRKTKNYRLRSINRIYVDRSLKLKKEYRASIKRTKIARTKRVNFLKSEKVRKSINKFVYKRTQSLIENLVPEGSIDSTTKMYLVNALYLKANWLFPFSKKLTGKSKFRVSRREVVAVTQMTNPHTTCQMYFDRTLDSHSLSLPMKGRELSMVFFVPNNAGDFSNYRNDNRGRLSTKISNAMERIEGSRSFSCELTIPKFKVEYEVQLINALKLMGIEDIFSPQLANLSRMVVTDPGLFVQDVRHKAALEAVELGIEAAASSAMGVVSRSYARPYRIKKPFLFVIKHNPSGAILFMGKIIRPSLN